ncbi:FAD binding domain-containing protein [Sodiomyces alkalinus F11]|uniref:FAD binding domain-containing protein n=1 Tax=Sodiomyces alkalinus (strain CBS 110278 / VKM F-3762 / F11) TaxID=1314773 RepID=A0A3N2PU04_SODAK|nr:FAD binding domain-containing protein [Sodiomyces alkalinus F11]ROT37988.1 FAD binding domain-containing protein [Sodiomyces alkalinus F11]
MGAHTNKFKVIIVGGGPNGLTAAHALYQAGINFVVLERRADVALDEGSSMVLGPASLRVMHQLGLYQRIKPISAEVDRVRNYLRTGTKYQDTTLPTLIKKNHGSGLIAFHRAHLVQALYDALPEDAKERYHLNKSVAEITTDASGATVTCTDGTSYTGTIVLGVDGVHSITRRLMRQLALAADPSLAPAWGPEQPFPATYRCLWYSFPRPEDERPGLAGATVHRDLSCMFITGIERAWVFLYEKMPGGPTTERHRYEEKDVGRFAGLFGDFVLDGTRTVRDTFALRLTHGMADLQEGIARRWSWGGRIVIAGDAAHKFMPNAGLGFNNGVQDIVALCNLLRGAVVEGRMRGSVPSAETLDGLFTKYRALRIRALEADAKESAVTGRLQAWPNLLYQLAARYLLTNERLMRFHVSKVAAKKVKKALVLDYAPAEEPFVGVVPWDNPIPSPDCICRS